MNRTRERDEDERRSPGLLACASGGRGTEVPPAETERTKLRRSPVCLDLPSLKRTPKQTRGDGGSGRRTVRTCMAAEGPAQGQQREDQGTRNHQQRASREEMPRR